MIFRDILTKYITYDATEVIFSLIRVFRFILSIHIRRCDEESRDDDVGDQWAELQGPGLDSYFSDFEIPVVAS